MLSFPPFPPPPPKRSPQKDSETAAGSRGWQQPLGRVVGFLGGSPAESRQADRGLGGEPSGPGSSHAGPCSILRLGLQPCALNAGFNPLPLGSHITLVHDHPWPPGYLGEQVGCGTHACPCKLLPFATRPCSLICNAAAALAAL